VDAQLPIPEIYKVWICITWEIISGEKSFHTSSFLRCSP